MIVGNNRRCDGNRCTPLTFNRMPLRTRRRWQGPGRHLIGIIGGSIVCERTKRNMRRNPRRHHIKPRGASNVIMNNRTNRNRLRRRRQYRRMKRPNIKRKGHRPRRKTSRRVGKVEPRGINARINNPTPTSIATTSNNIHLLMRKSLLRIMITMMSGGAAVMRWRK